MASFTPNFNIILPAVLSAEDANAWGNMLNANSSGLEGFLTQLYGSFAGPTAPKLGTTNNATIGQLWLNTANAPSCPLNIYTGTTWVLIGTLDTTNNTFTTPFVSSSVNQIVFTSSGVYTPTPGLTKAIVEVVGGGGGSAFVTANRLVIPGGGGGGYSRVVLSADAIGSSQIVTVGVGGTAGMTTDAPGGAGGSSSFGSLVTATGGAGGLINPVFNSIPAVTQGGMGTSSGPNALNLPGGPSQTQFLFNNNTGTTIYASSGNGGGGLYGSGGGLGVWTGFPLANAVSGNNGIPNTGGGASGGTSQIGTSGTAPGATGGSGIVIITEYIG